MAFTRPDLLPRRRSTRLLLPMTPAPPSSRPSSLRLLVTRPQPQADAWSRGLADAGFDARPLPLIAIGPPADEASVAAAWRQLAGCTAALFVSPAAAEGFFRLRPASGTGALPWPAGCHAAAPGPGTGRVLLALGVPASQLVMPAADAEQFDSESLWPRLAPHFPADGRPRTLLVVGGGDAGQPVRGRTWLAERLRERGAQVALLAAYRRGPAELDEAQAALLAAAAAEPAAHAWLLSSSESVDHLLCALRERGLPPPSAAWLAWCTHPRIAERARQAGFGRIGMSRPDLADVVAAVRAGAPAAPASLPPSGPPPTLQSPAP
jgi:uroporphyrinogen-III synthase